MPCTGTSSPDSRTPSPMPNRTGSSRRCRLEIRSSQAAGKPVRCDSPMPTRPATPKIAMAGQENSTERASVFRPASTKVMNRLTRPRKTTSSNHTRVELAKADCPRSMRTTCGVVLRRTGCATDWDIRLSFSFALADDSESRPRCDDHHKTEQRGRAKLQQRRVGGREQARQEALPADTACSHAVACRVQQPHQAQAGGAVVHPSLQRPERNRQCKESYQHQEPGRVVRK